MRSRPWRLRAFLRVTPEESSGTSNCLGRTNQFARKLCFLVAQRCCDSSRDALNSTEVYRCDMRVVSLLPAGTEIAAALGLMDQVVGVSHECDFPEAANDRPRVTRCAVHDSNLDSCEVDEWVRRALRENGSIYTIDEALLRKLQPDVILTQTLCDVCAVGYASVAKLAQRLAGPPRV